MDDAGCILSPGFPNRYPPLNKCEIDVKLPIFLVDATDFSVTAGDYGGQLVVGGKVFTGDDGPSLAFPGWHITWQTNGFTDMGWRICPDQELCVPLPQVGQTWVLLNWGGAVLVCCWMAAAVSILARASWRLINDAPPSPSTSQPPTSASSASTASMQMGPPSADDADGEVMLYAQSASLALQRGDMDALRECASLSGPWGVLFAAFMLGLDVLLDAYSINSLVLNGDIYFPGCIGAAVAWSTTSEIASGSLWALPGELRRKTLATGVPSDGWLSLLDGERGTEALVSLLVSTYGLPFATRTSLQMVLGPLSILTSTWSLATYVHEYVDLSVEVH